MTITLKELFHIENLHDYKVHFAKWNQKNQPLDVFTKDRREWQRWQEYRPTRNEFNRPMIFSLASFYHEPSAWLFGGIYKVLSRYDDRYRVKLTAIGGGFIGRLNLRSPYNSRAVRVNMESQYDDFEVSEILPELYTGHPFPGYEDIDMSFEEIETLVRNRRPDWKLPLRVSKAFTCLLIRRRTSVMWARPAVNPGSGRDGAHISKQVMAAMSSSGP